VHNFGTCKQNATAHGHSVCRYRSCAQTYSADQMLLTWYQEQQLKNVFGRKICQNSPMRSGIVFALSIITKLYTDLKPDFPLHFDIVNTQQNRMQKSNSSAWRLLFAAMLFFLSWVTNTQLNHWTRWVVSTHIITQVSGPKKLPRTAWALAAWMQR